MGRHRFQIDLLFALGRLFDLRHRAVRWLFGVTRQPAIGPRAERALFGPEQVTMRVLPVNVTLDRPGSVVLPAQVLEQLIRASAHRTLLDVCLCRDAFDCKHYPRDLGCLFLGSAAAEIHASVGRAVSVDEALAHVQRTLDLGLIPLAGRVTYDAILLGVSRAEHLMTVCFCCACCCTARFTRHLSPHGREGVQRLEGVEISVSDDCQVCDTCAGVCFVDAITVDQGRAVIGPTCLGCGRCATVCPEGAIELRADSEVVTRAVETLRSAVDVSR